MFEQSSTGHLDVNLISVTSSLGFGVWVKVVINSLAKIFNFCEEGYWAIASNAWDIWNFESGNEEQDSHFNCNSSNCFEKLQLERVLEHKMISNTIHNWFEIIFGNKQHSEESRNIYIKESYENFESEFNSKSPIEKEECLRCVWGASYKSALYGY